jgi:chromosome partitioning protein
LSFLSLVPSERDLVGIEIELVSEIGREFRLKQVLDPCRDSFDYILVDCPPSLGLLTLNALVAADGVVVPVQCEYLALEGVTQIMDTIERVRSLLNPGLAVDGIVMTMFDERTNLARQVVDEVRGVFGDRVYSTIIPRNVRLGEAPSHGKPIFLYDIRSRGADAYFELAKEFLEHGTQSTGARLEELDSATETRGVAGRESGGTPGNELDDAEPADRTRGDRRRGGWTGVDDRHRPDPA